MKTSANKPIAESIDGNESGWVMTPQAAKEWEIETEIDLFNEDWVWNNAAIFHQPSESGSTQFRLQPIPIQFDLNEPIEAPMTCSVKRWSDWPVRRRNWQVITQPSANCGRYPIGRFITFLMCGNAGTPSSNNGQPAKLILAVIVIVLFVFFCCCREGLEGGEYLRNVTQPLCKFLVPAGAGAPGEIRWGRGGVW